MLRQFIALLGLVVGRSGPPPCRRLSRSAGPGPARRRHRHPNPGLSATGWPPASRATARPTRIPTRRWRSPRRCSSRANMAKAAQAIRASLRRNRDEARDLSRAGLRSLSRPRRLSRPSRLRPRSASSTSYRDTRLAPGRPAGRGSSPFHRAVRDRPIADRRSASTEVARRELRRLARGRPRRRAARTWRTSPSCARSGSTIWPTPARAGAAAAARNVALRRIRAAAAALTAPRSCSSASTAAKATTSARTPSSPRWARSATHRPAALFPALPAGRSRPSRRQCARQDAGLRARAA